MCVVPKLRYSSKCSAQIIELSMEPPTLRTESPSIFLDSARREGAAELEPIKSSNMAAGK